MTPEAFRRLVGRISYKPGWAVDVLEDNLGSVLRICFTVADATLRAPQPLPLRVKHTVSDTHLALMEETDALDYIAEKVKAMERHEFREWFKLDGVAVYPAHSPGGELL